MPRPHSLSLTLAVGLALLASALGSANHSPEAPAQPANQKTVMCYFGSWSTYRWSYGQFDVEQINPFLCSHLIFGFAGLDPETYQIKSLDEYNDLAENWGKGAYQRFTGLKNQNPNLVTLLAIGGWNEGCTKYSEMVMTKERRSSFISSVVEMLKKHNFDGLDLDWEYPGGSDISPGFPEDKANYISLLRELREEFDQHGFQLTAAVSAGQSTCDVSYDVPQMSQYLDYINLMTYDYHGWFPNHAYTGHNAPLFSMPQELEPDSPGFQFNMEASVEYWLSHGAPKEKLVLGLAAYGRGFTLADKARTGFYAPSTSGINAGKYTGTAGFWGYNEYCEKMHLDGELGQWTVVTDPDVSAPYTYKGDQWLGYDDPESIRTKSQYVVDKGLGGAMIWSIDTDDFQNLCGQGEFPLISTVNQVLNGGPQTPPPDWSPTEPPKVPTTTASPDGPTHGPRPTPADPNDVCRGEEGFHRDQDNCAKYYQCVKDGDQMVIYEYFCQDGLLFDTEIMTCNWPDQVDC